MEQLPSLEQGKQHKQKIQNIMDETKQISYRFQGETNNNNIKAELPYFTNHISTKNEIEPFVDLHNYHNWEKRIEDKISKTGYTKAIDDTKNTIYDKAIPLVENFSTSHGFNISMSNDVSNALSNINNNISSMKTDQNITLADVNTYNDYLNNIKTAQGNIIDDNSTLHKKINTLRDRTGVVSDEKTLKDTLNKFISKRKEYRQLLSQQKANEVAIYEQLNQYNYNYAMMGVLLLGSVILLKYLLSS